MKFSESERAASADEIKSAYRKAALKWHPTATLKKNRKRRKVPEATEAYSILSEPQKRATTTLRISGLHAAVFDGGVNQTIFRQFQDIFGDFFRLRGYFRGRRARARSSVARTSGTT